MATGQLSKVVESLRSVLLRHDAAGITDSDLLRRYVQERDEAAFGGLVHRHGPMVMGVCRRVLHNLHDAEDAFQATFLVLVRKASSLQSPGMVGNWLYGVAYRTALEARTVGAKRRAKEAAVVPRTETSEDTWADLRPVLDQELERLAEKYRAVIVLCDLEGKTRKEAARQLNLPEGTVASRQATARAMLAKRLARHALAVSGGTLAAVLAQHATASVPLSMTSATIRAASLFAAGQAAAAGAISVKAVALAEGVIKTMLLTKLKIATAVLVGVALLGGGAAVLTPKVLAEKPTDPPVAEQKGPADQPVAEKQQPTAAQEKKEGEPRTREVSGFVKAVNLAKRTVTIAGKEGKNTYGMTKDANISIDGKPGDLAGLLGTVVLLSLSEDQKTARSIHAEAPQVSGIATAVDADKNTVRIADQGAEKTFAVGKDAKVEIDGKPGTLAEAAPGARITLGRVDLKTADSIRADGPGFHGLVKAVNADKNTVTVANRNLPSEPEKTLVVAKTAPIVIDGQPGKLAGLAPGAIVNLTLSADQKAVRSIQADGPGWRHIVVKAVDAEKKTITFDDQAPPPGTFTNNGPPPTELAGKTFPVMKNAGITIDGKPGQLSEVLPGALVALSLSANQKTVRSLQAYGPGWGRVVVKAVDAGKNTITFDDKVPHELAGKTFAVTKDAGILIDDKPGKLSGLAPGASIDVGLSVDQKAVCSFQTRGPGWTGVVVKAVAAEKNTITFDDDKAPAELAGKTFPVAKDASILIDGKAGKLFDLPPGARIDVGLSADQKTIRSFQTNGPGWGGVVVKAVDAEKNRITFDEDKAPAEVAGKTLPVAKDADIRIDGKPGKLSGVPPGGKVALALSVDQKTVRSVQADGPGWTGVVVKAVDAAKNTLTFDDDKAPAELAGKNFPVANDASIQINGQPARLAAVAPGTSIDVALSVDQKTIRRIQAKAP